MDSDGVYRRVNINKVMEQILKNNPNLTESKAQELALIMIKELNKKIISIVSDFRFPSVYASKFVSLFAFLVIVIWFDVSL